MRKRLSALCVGLVLMGCGDDGVSPNDARDVLVLTSVNGEPLPASFSVGSATQTFVADTIWLTVDDEWLRHRVYRVTESDGSVQDFDVRDEGHITRDGEAMILSFVCRDTPGDAAATCLPPARLENVDDRWTSSWGSSPLDSFAPFLEFERVAPR